jgi:hypothetical protein
MPNNAVAYKCGAVQECRGEPTVLNSNNNVLKMRLPVDGQMTPITGPVRQTLTVAGIVIPKGGFFPTKVAGQVRKNVVEKSHSRCVRGVYMKGKKH